MGTPARKCSTATCCKTGMIEALRAEGESVERPKRKFICEERGQTFEAANKRRVIHCRECAERLRQKGRGPRQLRNQAGQEEVKAMTDREKVRDKILEYYEKVLRERPLKFCENVEADRLVKEDPVAFVFAVIMDQGALAERMWEIPYHLKKGMGHLDTNKIAVMKAEDLYQIFEQLPHKPHYWRVAARRIISAARHINDRYGSEAKRLWNDNPKAGDLQSRLDNFEGIGQKKASTATRILGMDLKVPIRNWNEMDVSVDEMIKRVFPRAGLSKSNGQWEIIESARRLNPSFPGTLDYPCWDIGRTWCHKQNPECSRCYIGQVCPKIGT